MAPHFARLRDEIVKALEVAPLMKFNMPDPDEIETIQRDLSEKDARIQRARAEMERVKEAFGLTDDDFEEVFAERRGRHGRS
jgi:hypothetical protein